MTITTASKIRTWSTRLQRTARYFVRVYGSSEAGSDTSAYRLIAGAMPQVDYAMPAGGKAGSTVELTLRGVNLQGVDEVTLGDSLARAEVLSRSATEARVRLTVPAGTPRGDYRLHAGALPFPCPSSCRASRRSMSRMGGPAGAAIRFQWSCRWSCQWCHRQAARG